MLDLKKNLPVKQDPTAFEVKLNDSVPSFNKPEKPKKNIKNIILTTFGLLSFFILGLAGVLISQKQFIDDSIKAPNAPDS
ncbi:MAG: hypothetical protein IT416_01730, partial [Candidatus Pacebacteria bacterium]|nr:hypothetical protein [Candidatus Paceibacterota bacterium]